MIKTDWTMQDIVEMYVEHFIEKEYVKTKADAKRLFIETLSRTAVFNEVETMALFIADEERYFREQDGGNL